MKHIKRIALFVFSMIIILPVFAFNFEKDAISEIDNRVLTGNPFLMGKENADGDLTQNIQNYVNDRIGFRSEMIRSFTILNDKLFGKMVHPSYSYGKEGYVFGNGITVNTKFGDYHLAFADMVKEIQDYCEERNVPFLFVFDPAKPAVLTEYIADGINYDRKWVDDFFDALDERNVRYIDNTILLREKAEAGENVFNQKYDANHWNDLGAYYGVNAILEELKKDIATVHVNKWEELDISQELKTSLLVSEFPIEEYVPKISVEDKGVSTVLYEAYEKEIERNSSFRGFGYYQNVKRLTEEAPRALVFQGSYMNSYGSKFLSNAFSEYIHVHDYQNVIDFPYYFNIFQPDCVIFEVAEYTFSDTYFNYQAMNAMKLNPLIANAIGQLDTLGYEQLKSNIEIDKGEVLTKIRWGCNVSLDYVWLCLDKEYDMKKNETGYEVTITTETFEECGHEMKIVSSATK